MARRVGYEVHPNSGSPRINTESTVVERETELQIEEPERKQLAKNIVHILAKYNMEMYDQRWLPREEY